MSVKKEYKLIALIELVTVFGLISLWIIGKSSADLEVANKSYHFVYDTVFPVGDLVMTVFLLFSSVRLVKGQSYGASAAAVAAVMMIYFGILDFSPCIAGTRYALSFIDVMASGAANLWFIVMGFYIVLILLKRGRFTESAYNHHRRKNDTAD